MRLPFSKEEVKVEEIAPAAKPKEEQPVNLQVVEREINLSLINEKLNYIVGILHRLCEVGEIDLNK